MRALIDEAEALLFRASELGGSGASSSRPRCNRRTPRGGPPAATDWAAISRLYDALAAMTGSPVVAINRAVALAELHGPEAGLAALDALAEDSRLAGYQPYWAARAELLARTGAVEAADAAYERAIGLEADPAVRRFLQQRRAALAAGRPRSV